MMDLEQRMEEINSRSQAILRQRRRRNRVLLSCVPLVLCVAVFAGALLRHGGGLELGTPENWSGSAVVTVTQGDQAYEIEDPVRVAQIFNAFSNAMKIPAEDYVYGGAIGGADLPEADGGSDSAIDGVTGEFPASGDIVEITLDDGTTHFYQLLGNQLTDRSTGRTVDLSGEIVAELRVLLEKGE